MAVEKGATRRATGSIWVLTARGAALSLLVWACGLGLLTAVLTAGAVGEDSGFPALLGLTAFASFVGAVSAARRASWGSMSSAMVVTGLFATVLLCVGLLSWREISWVGHGGQLLLWTLIGGAAAGLAGRRRTPKRTRRQR